MTTIKYRSADVDGLKVFYREAGAAGAPAGEVAGRPHIAGEGGAGDGRQVPGRRRVGSHPGGDVGVGASGVEISQCREAEGWVGDQFVGEDLLDHEFRAAIG